MLVTEVTDTMILHLSHL